MLFRTVAVALVVATSSCSFAMKSLQDDWDGTAQPDCSDNVLTPVGDAIIAGLALGVASIAIERGDDAIGIPSGVVGIGFAVAALIGSDNRSTCRDAKRTWAVGGRIGTASAVHSARVARKQTAPLPASPAQPTASTLAGTAPLRGFFCSNSPSNAVAGFCVRDKAECQRTRDAAIVGVADLTDCTLTERAFCFGERCAPTVDACDATRIRVAGKDGRVPDCAVIE